MVPLWFYILGTGFTFPCVQVLALAKPWGQSRDGSFPAGGRNVHDGRASCPGGGVAGHRIGHPHGRVQAACILLGIAALWLVVRPRTVPSIH